MPSIRLLVLACVIPLALGFKELKHVSYTQLPTSISSAGAELFQGIEKGTADAAAYDWVNHVLYVVGRTSHLMHVIDLTDPANPVRLFIHQFTRGEGFPNDIDICGGEIAVALSANREVNEGHVRFYHTYTRGSGATDVVLDGYVTVGPYPKSIRYTDDCQSVIVANEGIPGKDEFNTFVNPEGSVTIIHNERTGNPAVQTVDFRKYNTDDAAAWPYRVPSKYIPIRPTVAEGTEPEDVVVSSDGRTAWVTLLENDAIAEISITAQGLGLVNNAVRLPRKDWASKKVDTSDQDGGTHRRMYAGLKSLRQPGKIARLRIDNKDFLITADQGGVTSFTNAKHGFTWTDATTGKSLAANIDNPELKANANDVGYLGRLQVSSLEGKLFDGKNAELVMFGGRGISIWDSKNFVSPMFDSEGSIEEYTDSFFHDIFNCDYIASTATTKSPDTNKDTTSYRQGDFVSGLDVADDNGTVYMVVGMYGTGSLILYEVDTSAKVPIPMFQNIVRTGGVEDTWSTLYTNKKLGDLHISDLGIITSDQSPVDRPLLWVVGAGSGSVSIYNITESLPVIPGR
ncbi:uncharacterized protein LOC128209272 [Mya arenaria]|uniref:uncharacterized protein LOC128209272 n=1 Tax=Mya arenaria TaxID=6604 RepID=UPI0022E0C397|nr:uncharacterized protein LOC128209272 [Mya arenaria]